MFIEKYILISGFLTFLEVKVLGKVFILIYASSVQIISGLDSKSKFQMFTLFSGRHVGVPWRYANMAAPYWGSVNLCKIFQQIFEDRTDLKLEEVP